MKRFAVGFADLDNVDLNVIIIDATDWKDAVMVHPNYPYRQQYESDNTVAMPGTPISELIARYPDLSEKEAVKQCCFDCDCLMGWIEIDELTSPPIVLQ